MLMKIMTNMWCFVFCMLFGDEFGCYGDHQSTNHLIYVRVRVLKKTNEHGVIDRMNLEWEKVVSSRRNGRKRTRRGGKKRNG